jgi:hypothetical protein
MLIGYKRGQGSIVLRIKILNSSVATGAGLTGLSSASSGLIISTIADNEATATAYTVAASNVETITTIGTYAAPSSGKCRFREVDATNHKGVYEIQLADARYSVSNAKSLLVSVLGATNAAETDVVIPLRDLDPFDAVRAGLTALPNVASGSAGAIITSGTGTAQLSVASGLVTVGTNNDKTGYSLTQAFPANFASLGINASGHISRVTLVDTTTTNTDMRGTDGAALASSWTSTRAGYLDSVLLAANSNRTVQVTGSQHVAADLHESQPESIHATTFDAGSIDAAALATDAAAEIAGAVLTTAMTESYRATNAAPTLAQAAFELLAHMGEASIAGTTKTLKKIDGTTAKTFTLDSSTAPTSITETT